MVRFLLLRELARCEAEEAEIERMLKEMQIQQNAPVKKNPLTEIIGDF